jgi:hypothetical protein
MRSTQGNPCRSTAREKVTQIVQPFALVGESLGPAPRRAATRLADRADFIYRPSTAPMPIPLHHLSGFSRRERATRLLALRL